MAASDDALRERAAVSKEQGEQKFMILFYDLRFDLKQRPEVPF